MGADRMRRSLAAVAFAVALATALSSCAQPNQGDAMSPQEARDRLVSTVEHSAAQLDVDGWARAHAAEAGNCGATAGTDVDFTYVYGAPQPDGDHDADAKTISDFWKSLGMTVRTVVTNGDPVVYGTGGPVSGLLFSTAPGNYFISGSSLCVPGDADELRKKETTE